MQVELGSIRWRGAWERVEYTTTDCFPLPCKFLHELKISSDGNVAQLKSRLVACRNMSKEGHHFIPDEINVFFCIFHGSSRAFMSIAIASDLEMAAQCLWSSFRDINIIRK